VAHLTRRSRSADPRRQSVQSWHDTDLEGLDEATRQHRERYHVAEEIYLAEVESRKIADVIVDNRDFARPRLLTAES
jgi:hypothetical protein